MPTWPAISTAQYAQIQLALVDQRSSFQPDLGPPKTMALDRSIQVMTAFDLILEGSELSAFQSWWEVDLERGAESFTGLEGVVGDNQSRYVFRERPQFVEIRGGNASNRLWRAPVRLWRLRAAIGVYAEGVYEVGVFETGAGVE